MKTPRLRLAFLLLAAVALVTGVAGGLARLGAVPTLLPSATAFHGALMASGFLGTVIGLERAVALGHRFAYLAPLASGLGTILLLAGLHAAGAVLWIAAPLALFAASVAIARRQPELHTMLLAVASLAWAAGSVLFFTGAAQAAPAWWYAFLVLTIAAERLEMTRLLKRRPWSTPLFIALVAGLIAAAAVTVAAAREGAVLYGLALVALAAWLAVFDIARRTIRTHGFARYAAVALLAGYGWLAVAGLAWAFAPAQRDMALHALGLGFVFSMILAHAPLIVPVIARVKMRYVPFFYVPLALLHGSLLVRLFAGASDPATRSVGGALNAAALVVFVATLLYAIATRDRGTSAPRG